MKTKKLETIVLAAAGAIIIAALVFLFVLDSNPNSGLWVNILLATGFLLYIVYNVLTSANYNKQVEGLEQQLQTETAAKDRALEEVEQLTAGWDATKKQLSKVTADLDAATKEKATLVSKVAELETSLQAMQAADQDSTEESSPSSN
ncbi:MAG: hypothetical protein LAT76_11685 [Schleiferiaceae bacterium]|nr:hypothetical protein [Schleiferiaceae bacterium]